MTLRADELIDRRRLRRKLTFWRVAAVLVALAAVIAGASLAWDKDYGAAAADQIAKIRIEGTITEDEDLLDLLDRVRQADRVKGVILAVDSPGGTTAGGEAIFNAVRRLAAVKPVTAQVGTLAASAGYMIASASDHIVARQSSIVGSIGVLVQIPNVSGLMQKIGVSVDEVKSAPLKAEPSPFNPTTDEERAMIARLIQDSYDWFVGLVVERRALPRDQVLKLADGSIFTGRQALASKLVDALGGEEEAVHWLESKGVPTELDVVEWKPKDEDGWFGGSASALSLLGLDGWARRAGAEALFLDGLVSLWHPVSLAGSAPEK